MGFKEFLRPTKWIAAVALILSFATLLIPLPMDLPSTFWGSEGNANAPLALTYLLIVTMGGPSIAELTTPSILFFLMILTHLAIIYIITCLIFLGIDKFKN